MPNEEIGRGNALTLLRHLNFEMVVLEWGKPFRLTFSTTNNVSGSDDEKMTRRVGQRITVHFRG